MPVKVGNNDVPVWIEVPTLVLTEGQLQKIKDAALYNFKHKHNNCVAPDLYPLICYLEALQEHMNREQIGLKIELPSRQAYASVDDE